VEETPMTLEADQIVERRRLKRSRNLWRFGAMIGLILAVLAGLAATGVSKFGLGPHVARVKVEGVIMDSENLVKAIDGVAGDDSAKALIVAVDSPGGTVTGAQAIYEAVRRVGAKKPVVAVMGALAASGGYVVSLGADHVIAGRNTITGSIGVILQAFEVSGLLQKVGVQVNEIKSAPLKGEPSEFHPLTPEGRKATEALVQDAYEWFVGLVAERRKLSPDAARTLGDGRVYSGRQALEVKLVDELGDERNARAWLSSQYHIAGTVPVRDVDISGQIPGLPGAQNRALSALSILVTGKAFDSKPLTLDGLVAIWHPAS
jgi:protease IV